MTLTPSEDSSPVSLSSQTVSIWSPGSLLLSRVRCRVNTSAAERCITLSSLALPSVWPGTAWEWCWMRMSHRVMLPRKTLECIWGYGECWEVNGEGNWEKWVCFDLPFYLQTWEFTLKKCESGCNFFLPVALLFSVILLQRLCMKLHPQIPTLGALGS